SLANFACLTLYLHDALPISWICAWHTVHERPTILLAFVELPSTNPSYTVGGCLEVTWHRWQRNGRLATSMRSLFEPCGSWQVTQDRKSTRLNSSHEWISYAV